MQTKVPKSLFFSVYNMWVFLPISLFDGICTQTNINTNVNLKNKKKTIFDYLYIEIQSSHNLSPSPQVVGVPTPYLLVLGYY